MKISVKAPCRVDLAGGTLDIWPLYLFHEGALTVNFAVTRYATCAVETLSTPEISFESRDLGREEHFHSLADLRQAPAYSLPLPAYLVKFFAPEMGLRITTDSEAPAGAGIAGSSTLMIALASALNQLTGAGHSLEKLREIAQNVEAQIIRVPTGSQDYYPAMYGGVCAIELGAAGVKREEIRVDATELNDRFVLAYTGEPRNSGINNWEVMKAHIDGNAAVHRNFDRIAAIAIAMRAALARADWREAGRLLREEWEHRRANAPGITTGFIDELIRIARREGSLGAKVCGAGGGGCVVFLAECGAKERVAQALSAEGAIVLPASVASEGVQLHSAQLIPLR